MSLSIFDEGRVGEETGTGSEVERTTEAAAHEDAAEEW